MECRPAAIFIIRATATDGRESAQPDFSAANCKLPEMQYGITGKAGERRSQCYKTHICVAEPFVAKSLLHMSNTCTANAHGLLLVPHVLYILYCVTRCKVKINSAIVLMISMKGLVAHATRLQG